MARYRAAAGVAMTVASQLQSLDEDRPAFVQLGRRDKRSARSAIYSWADRHGAKVRLSFDEARQGYIVRQVGPRDQAKRERRLALERDHQRDKLARLRAEGICIACADAKAAPGYRKCRPCIDYRQEYMQDYRERVSRGKARACDSNG